MDIGHTSGPKGFSGPIGKELTGCEALKLVEFTCIQCDLPSTLPDDLSTDQKYLYDMCNAISVGICPVALSLRNPGLMNHSRWLTTANRTLRLYVSTLNPSYELRACCLHHKGICTYVVRDQDETLVQGWWTRVSSHCQISLPEQRPSGCC